MSTSPQVTVALPVESRHALSNELMHKQGERYRIVRARHSDIPVGTVIILGSATTEQYRSACGNDYCYYVKHKADGSVCPSSRGVYHTDLEPVISIKAYAYHHKSTNEFHWFSSEKDRKGYTRFISHDIESYK